MIRQLTFDIALPEARGRADFIVTPANALAFAMLEGWCDWPAGKCVLTGPPGSGKTHLAHLWASENGGSIVPARDLANADLPRLAVAPVVIEDAELLHGSGAETAAFHLHNLLLETGQPLLVTAAVPPRDWGIILPDLVSRMQAAPLTRLEAPDDALLRAVLGKQFADRQILVAPALIDWVIPRMHRSLAAARDLVAALDARALAERRPITREMAQDWLNGPGLFDRAD